MYLVVRCVSVTALSIGAQVIFFSTRHQRAVDMSSAALRVGPGGLGFIKANTDAAPAAWLKLDPDAEAEDGLVWTLPRTLPETTQYLRVDAVGALSYGTPAGGAWAIAGDGTGNIIYGSGTVLINTEDASMPAGTYKLEVAGAARFDQVVAPIHLAVSDKRLKDCICPVAPAEAVRRLQLMVGVDYHMRATGEKATGLLAQDVQVAQPWSVSSLGGKEGHLGVRYNDVVGLLVAGFQALVQRTDALASDVAGLTAENQALRQRMFAVESSFT
jgi:hypothetical protein